MKRFSIPGTIIVILLLFVTGCEDMFIPEEIDQALNDEATTAMTDAPAPLIIEKGDSFDIELIDDQQAGKGITKAIGDNEPWQYLLTTGIRSTITNEMLYEEPFAVTDKQLTQGYKLRILVPMGGPYLFEANVKNQNGVIIKTGATGQFSIEDETTTAKPSFSWHNGSEGSLAMDIPPIKATLGVTAYDFDGNLHANSNVRIYDSSGTQLYSVCTNQFVSSVWDDSTVYGLSYFNLEPGTYKVEAYLCHSSSYKMAKEITLGLSDMKNTLEFRYATTDRIITLYNSADKALTDFPVEIPFNGDNLFFAKTTENGNDLRFYSADKRELSYWIKSWNKTGQTGTVWVKVPAIPANGTATLYLNYGDSSQPAQSNANAVFTGYWAYPDYAGWYDNWGFPVRTYSVYSYYHMMGGFNNYGSGAYTQYRFTDLPVDTYAIDFDFYFWDSWDSEYGQLFANNIEIWAKQSRYNWNEGNLGNQGGGYWNDRLIRDNQVSLNHTGGNLMLRFTSNLSESASNESFGVDNIIVRKTITPSPVATVYK